MLLSLLNWSRHHIRVLGAAVIVVLFIFSPFGNASRVSAAGVQPMGLLKGGSIDFTTGSKQYLRAFCLDRRLAPPSPMNVFDNYHGKVELTFADNTKRVFDLGNPAERSQAFKHFSIKGTGSASSLEFAQTDNNLRKIEFLSSGIAHTGDQDDFTKVLGDLEMFEELTSSLPPPHSSINFLDTRSPAYSEAQRRIWADPYRVKRVKGESVTYDYKYRDEARTAVQRIINLDGRGDATLVRYGDLHLLIDTGLSTEGFVRIANKLPKNIRLHVILTHRDQDHIGNLTRLLMAAANAQIGIENVMMSSYEVPSEDKGAASTLVVKRLLDELKVQKYQRKNLSPQLAVFSSQNAAPIVSTETAGLRKLLEEARRDVKEQGPLSKLLTATQRDRLMQLQDTTAIQTYELSLSPDVKLTVFQKANPKSPNESSLITKLVHNGRSTLYTGDINENVMQDLLAENSQQQGISLAGIAPLQFTLSYLKEKWPNEYSQLKDRLDHATSAYEAQDAVYEVQARILRADKVFQSQRPAAFGNFPLRANVLKWPHHAWLPKTDKGKQTLRQFIEAVNPGTIVFSISPESAEIKFSPAEFADADSFVARMKSRGDPLSRWLFESFSESLRQQLTANNFEGAGRELRQQLAHQLTRLIQGPLIYRDDLFVGVDLTGMRPLNSTLPDTERALVNRELLERAYPHDIGEIRGQNIEKVKSYLRQYFPSRDFNIVITARDGDAEFLTKNGKPLNDMNSH